MRAFQNLILIAFLLALVACAPGSNAMLQTLRNAWAEGDDATRGGLNPNFRYIRVVIAGRPARLTLGYIDPHPMGPIEVWYSADREVLRIQNGRLVGAAGTATEWRSVSLAALPAWSSMQNAGTATQWLRTRDVMPGYRFNVRDTLTTYPIAPPAKTQLVDIDPNTLAWFEERDDTGARAVNTTKDVGDPLGKLPAARYAVSIANGVETVMYGEQCLAPALCFTWQRWPVAASQGFKP
jgi:hypothetical protein